MHFTLPAYVGRSALRHIRLSPWMMRLSSSDTFFAALFFGCGISSWYGTVRWWFCTVDFPLNWSMAIGGCRTNRPPHHTTHRARDYPRAVHVMLLRTDTCTYSPFPKHAP